MIEILKPMYFGNNPENRKIGIAAYRLHNEPEIVEIDIKHHRSSKKGGGFIYPGKYFISKANIAKYPLQNVKTKSGYEVQMYIVPIKELKRKEIIPTKAVVFCDKVIDRQGVLL